MSQAARLRMPCSMSTRVVHHGQLVWPVHDQALEAPRSTSHFGH